MKILDVMTRDPRCCRPEDDLATAAQMMWDADCGAIPVVGEGGRVVGIVTDRDACMAALMNGRPLHELRVEQAMSKNVATCRPGDDVRDAHALMRKRKVRRLPVTEANGRILGIVSLHDGALAALSDRRRILPRVRLRDVALTFAEISRPNPKPAPPQAKTNVAYAE